MDEVDENCPLLRHGRPGATPPSPPPTSEVLNAAVHQLNAVIEGFCARDDPGHGDDNSDGESEASESALNHQHTHRPIHHVCRVRFGISIS